MRKTERERERERERWGCFKDVVITMRESKNVKKMAMFTFANTIQKSKVFLSGNSSQRFVF